MVVMSIEWRLFVCWKSFEKKMRRIKVLRFISSTSGLFRVGISAAC